MNELIAQSPPYVSLEDINIIYQKNNCDKIKTLIELWNIKDTDIKDTDIKNTDIKNTDIKDTSQETWTKIRDICDAFDGEMYNQIKNINN